jgi:hypothetical protein
MQALLHPTENSVESNGPLSGTGPSNESIVRLSEKSEEYFCGRLTVRAKVNTAALVIVDAHGEVVAIHERNCRQKGLKEYIPSITDYRNNQLH